MSLYQILCLFGFTTVFLAVIKFIINQIKGVRLGVQALLRAQMISDFNKYHDWGYAPIYARENFQNCWKQYHSLGANGVMDDLHEKFLELPTEKEI